MSELDTNMMDFRELRAEVERLRAENERLESLFQQTHAVHHSWVDKVAKLEAEIAELRKDRDEHVEASIDLCAERDALKATLAWFEEFEAIALRGRSEALSWWLQKNPKPE